MLYQKSLVGILFFLGIDIWAYELVEAKNEIGFMEVKNRA